MKRILSMSLLATLVLTLTSCANSPLGAMVSKHPSMDDVEKMEIGKTTKKDVSEKFSGQSEQLINGDRCFTYFKPSFIGEATKTTYLCFDKDGLLKQKYFM